MTATAAGNGGRELAVLPDRPLSVEAIKEQVQTIQRLLKEVMIKDVHFGIVPGTSKPSLWKAGAEKIAATFQIRRQVVVEDLSHGGEYEYRVKVVGLSASGMFLGEGVGHYSTLMTKYKWRKAVCQEEFDATPETRRRTTWKWVGSKDKGMAVEVNQVRQEPADLANTILKMATKSGDIAMVLSVTAASDVFSQDLDPDDPTNRGAPNGNGKGAADRPPAEPPRRSQGPAKPRNNAQTQRASGPPADTISEKQRGRLFYIANDAGKSKEQVTAYLKEEHGLDSSHQITRDVYEEICTWAEDKNNNWPSQA